MTERGDTDDVDAQWRVKRRVTLVGAVVNLLLACGKIVFGWLGHSQALIVDGVHSLSDLLSDAMVLLAARLASRSADSNHPYGHARIETVASGAMGLLLIAVAIGFIVDASRRLIAPETLLIPGTLALTAALVSVLAKEALYHYTIQAAKRLRSGLIRANAWHHRSDALSSLVVIGGIAGAMLGVYWLDAVAAILVAGMIGRMGWDFTWQALRELVDTGLDASELQALRRRIAAVDGVRGHHALRTRRMGNRVVLDVHIQVDPQISLSEAHRIARAVEARLLQHEDDIGDVLVSVEPTDHSPHGREPPIPLRPAAEAALRRAWAQLPALPEPLELQLHYRGESMLVDVVLPEGWGDPAEDRTLAAALHRAAAHLPWLSRVRVLRAVSADAAAPPPCN